MAFSRRSFLRGALLGGPVAATATWNSAGCGNAVDPAPIVDATVDDDPASPTYGRVIVCPARIAPLSHVGGAVNLRIAPPGDAMRAGRARPFRVPAGVLLIHRSVTSDPPAFVAMESACPHAGCPLGYSSVDRLVECPCHGSRFLAVPTSAIAGSCAGQVVHGPARSGPTVYQVTLGSDGETVEVDLSATVGCAALPALVGGRLVLPLGDYPALSVAGGWIIGVSPGFSDAIAVVRVSAASDDSAFTAVDAVCTHLHCTVAYVDGDKLFECPCHGSRYDLGGNVVNGPAQRALARYVTRFDGATLTVEIP